MIEGVQEKGEGKGAELDKMVFSVGK